MMKARHAADVSQDKPAKSHPHVDWAVYRDCKKYPGDPRKPCNDCVRPKEIRSTKIKMPGYLGRPYMDKELGGCDCGSRKCKHCKLKKNQLGSRYWPRPLSAKLDEKFPTRAAKRYDTCQKRKLVDIFDRLENFRLINYTRTDDGYRGDRWCRDNDPYGCLGESRHLSRVAGVGFRSPGTPVAPANTYGASSMVPNLPEQVTTPDANGAVSSSSLLSSKLERYEIE